MTSILHHCIRFYRDTNTNCQPADILARGIQVPTADDNFISLTHN